MDCRRLWLLPLRAQQAGTYFGADAAAVGSPITNFTSINTNTDRNFGLAVYGQVTYIVSPQFDITAGLRYDHEHKKESVKGEFQPDGADAIVTPVRYFLISQF
jgi:iron complex outermembrane receptor protein